MNALSPQAQALVSTALSPIPSHEPDAALIAAARDVCALADRVALVPMDIQPGTPENDDNERRLDGLTDDLLQAVRQMASIQATTHAGLVARAISLARVYPRDMCNEEVMSRISCTHLDALLRDGAALADTLAAQPNFDVAFLAHLDAYDALEAEIGRLARQHGETDFPPNVEAEMKCLYDAQENEAEGMVRAGCVTEHGRRRLALTLSHQGVGAERDDPRWSPEDRMEALLIRSLVNAARAPISASSSPDSPDADILALKPDYDRLVADAVALNYGDAPGTDADIERVVGPFLDLCQRVTEMPAARTATGRSFKAAAAYQYLWAHETETAEAIRVLREIAAECGL